MTLVGAAWFAPTCAITNLRNGHLRLPVTYFRDGTAEKILKDLVRAFVVLSSQIHLF